MRHVAGSLQGFGGAFGVLQINGDRIGTRERLGGENAGPPVRASAQFIDQPAADDAARARDESYFLNHAEASPPQTNSQAVLSASFELPALGC